MTRSSGHSRASRLYNTLVGGASGKEITTSRGAPRLREESVSCLNCSWYVSRADHNLMSWKGGAFLKLQSQLTCQPNDSASTLHSSDWSP